MIYVDHMSQGVHGQSVHTIPQHSKSMHQFDPQHYCSHASPFPGYSASKASGISFSESVSFNPKQS